MKSFLQFLLFVLVITLALAGLYAWKSGQTVPAPAAPVPAEEISSLPAVQPALNAGSVPGLAALDDEFVRVAEAVIPSVVSITARKNSSADPREEFLRQYFGLGQPPKEETGSGVIVSEEGHIVTNLHVIDGAQDVVIVLSDGQRHPAQLLGVDPFSDLAILKIDAPGLKPLAFGDSEKVRVGQMVFAVGAPYGLQETVTMGIISGRDRLISSETVNEFLQTDAPINPGNSGGPLVNIRGEIVGINNRIKTESGGSQGVAFSIPSNTVRRVLEQILEHGRVLRPYLGVVMAPMDAAMARQLGLPSSGGALVDAVLQGSPADLGGIRAGDVILKFDGRDIRDFNDLRKRVALAATDKEVQVEIMREGRTMSLPVTIVEQQPGPRSVIMPVPAAPGPVTPQPAPAPPLPPLAPQPPPLPPVVPPGTGAQAPLPVIPADGNALAGVVVGEITPMVVRREQLPRNIEGVVVRAVPQDSPAAGILRPGDAIEQINDTPVPTPEDFARVVGELAPGERVIVLLSRGRVRSFEVLGP